jgi:STE24 endopeptidase
MNTFCIFIAVLIFCRAAVSLYLDFINRRHVTLHALAVPKGMEGFVDFETYSKSVVYTLAKNRFASFEMLYSSAVLALVLFSGVLPWLYAALEGWLGASVAAQAAILMIIGQVFDIPEWPLEYWSTFKLEQSFGFNKSTRKLWVTDKVKGILLSAAIMFPLFCLVLVLVRVPYWWVWAFVCVFAFQLVMMIVYPIWIMPLFNKFTPLDEGPLKERLMSLAERTDFKAKTILVMDGSRRSGHSNAFFTGIGKSRRVVLFDTLIQQLSEEELEAVLAHEIGHYKKGHIMKSLVVAGVLTLAAFAFIGWLAESSWFVMSFGFSYNPEMLGPVLLLFSMMAGLGGFWFTPLGAMFSRKHEYEADAFARFAMGGDPAALVNALRKLHTGNLSNLVPHPMYSAFHYSHPTLVEREAALNKPVAE